MVAPVPYDGILQHIYFSEENPEKLVRDIKHCFEDGFYPVLHVFPRSNLIASKRAYAGSKTIPVR